MKVERLRICFESRVKLGKNAEVKEGSHLDLRFEQLSGRTEMKSQGRLYNLGDIKGYALHL